MPGRIDDAWPALSADLERRHLVVARVHVACDRAMGPRALRAGQQPEAVVERPWRGGVGQHHPVPADGDRRRHTRPGETLRLRRERAPRATHVGRLVDAVRPADGHGPVAAAPVARDGDMDPLGPIEGDRRSTPAPTGLAHGPTRGPRSRAIRGVPDAGAFRRDEVDVAVVGDRHVDPCRAGTQDPLGGPERDGRRDRMRAGVRGRRCRHCHGARRQEDTSR